MKPTVDLCNTGGRTKETKLRFETKVIVCIEADADLQHTYARTMGKTSVKALIEYREIYI